MLLESECHLTYYEFVYGTRDPARVREALGAPPDPRAAPRPRRRRWSFPECRDLSNFISSARSRLSRSLDASRRNSFSLRSLLSPSAHKPIIKKPRTRSVEVYFHAPVRQQASESHNTTPEYVKESPAPIHMLSAVIDPTPKEPAAMKSTDSSAHVEQENSKFTRVSEVVHSSPYKANLRKCTAVCSGVRLSGFQACQSSVKMNDLTDQHPSPPSPAPNDPSQARRCFCVEGDQTITIFGTDNQSGTFAEVYSRPTVTREKRTGAVTVSAGQVRRHGVVDPLDQIEPAEPDNEYEKLKGEIRPTEEFLKNVPLSNVTSLRAPPGFLHLRYNYIVVEISILLDHTPLLYKNYDEFKTYWTGVIKSQPEPRSHKPMASDLGYNTHLPLGVSQLEEYERKVIIRFCHLFEKSKQLFNGLREVPSCDHNHWRSYFVRSFTGHAKLWKYQQKHRDLLDLKYGLKRSQIGEIASNIGHLYYHLYLRTSETAYLNEAFFFYCAIRDRSYYAKASEDEKYEVMVNKLRYYVRFIVVCLLWKEFELARELLNDLNAQIIVYGTTYDPDDTVEWNIVLDEAKAFMLAEPVVAVGRAGRRPLALSHRLDPGPEARPRGAAYGYYLAEAVIVGSSAAQARVAQLSLDMYRMLQAVEYERGAADAPDGPRHESPHKHLLYCPAPSQLKTHLWSGCNQLRARGVLMLYLSGGAARVGYRGARPPPTPTDDPASCGTRRFHPDDLLPYIRWPLFVIVDSEDSDAFQYVPRVFDQPLVLLMSSVETPTFLNACTAEGRAQGRLLTLFLYSPLEAFCYICEIRAVPLDIWEAAQRFVDTFMTEAVQLITRLRVDGSYVSLMGDALLRTLVARFVWCGAVLRLHRAFRARAPPLASPPLPEELFKHPSLTFLIMELSSLLQVRGFLHNPFCASPTPPRE